MFENASRLGDPRKTVASVDKLILNCEGSRVTKLIRCWALSSISSYGEVENISSIGVIGRIVPSEEPVGSLLTGIGQMSSQMRVAQGTPGRWTAAVAAGLGKVSLRN